MATKLTTILNYIYHSVSWSSRQLWHFKRTGFAGCAGTSVNWRNHFSRNNIDSNIYLYVWDNIKMKTDKEYTRTFFFRLRISHSVDNCIGCGLWTKLLRKKVQNSFTYHFQMLWYNFQDFSTIVAISWEEFELHIVGIDEWIISRNSDSIIWSWLASFS